MFLKYSRIDL